jgi:hypothetical protein
MTTEPGARTVASLFVFSPAEQAAVARILRDFPEATLILAAGLRPIVALLARELQGHLLSEDDAYYVLAGLADRVVGRTITETGGLGEADELRTAGIDLLARHLLAGMRDDFLQRVLVRRQDQTG